MNNMCLSVTPSIRELANKIKETYPQACQRNGFTDQMCAEWVGIYNTAHSHNMDNTPSMKSLINHIEKLRNKEGKSFIRNLDEEIIQMSAESSRIQISYNLPGQKPQIYTVEGTHIYNKEGKEVYLADKPESKTHRNRIFANLAVKQGRAVVVDYKNRKYVVNDKNVIMSASGKNPGQKMGWGEENGDRKEILRLAQIAFREKQKAEPTTTNSTIATEAPKVEVFNGYWTREQVANQQDKIFLFGDNTNDRVSAHYVPSSTQAVIRGLPNAIGIDTKKNRGTGANSYFSDADFDQFKTQVDFALNAAKADGRTIVIPADGIGTGKALLKEKAPKCFEYLQSELQKLKNGEYIKPSDSSNVSNITMSNELENSIKTGVWTKETINEFDNYIKAIKNEKIDIEQRVGEGRSLSQGRSEIHEGASLVIAAKTGASKERRGNPQAEYEVDAAEGREQERLLEAWAKAADLWLNDYKDAEGNKANTLEDLLNSQWQYLNIGSEAEVYEYDDNTVLKSINLSHANDNPGKLLDRIALFNILFPNTALEIVGFGRDSQGHFRVIVTQPYIEGSELTDEDLKEFHQKYKLQQVEGWFKTKYPGVLVTDLSPSNIKKDKEGRYYIIDADVKYDESIADINPVLEQFMRDIDLLAGYYEGGGRVLSDDLSSITQELDDKLNNYFMGGVELSIEDYRELYKYISVAPDPNGNSSSPYIAVPKQQQPAQNATLSIIPVQAADKKASAKGSISNKFIGYADGIQDSSTAEYARQAGNKANVGIYNSNDTVFVSIPGMRGNEDIRHSQQDKTITEALKALNAGATLVTDNKAYIEKSTYNEGEKKLAKALTDAGAIYSEQIVNGETLGIWKKQPTQQPSINTSPSVNSSSPSLGGVNTTASTGVRFATGEEAAASQQKAAEEAARKEAEANKPKPQRPKETDSYKSALQSNEEDPLTKFRRTFSPQQIKDRGAMIADHFSEILDTAVKDQIAAEQKIVDDPNASEEDKLQAKREIVALRHPVTGRQKAAQTMTIDVIMTKIKEKIKSSLKFAPDDSKIKWQNTLDFFEELFNTQATLNIEEREGIRIIGLTISKTVAEEKNESNNDGNDDTGHTATGSDGWSYQIRYENPFDSLSKKVRSMLYDVERPSSEIDDLGQTRKYPMRQIYASLLSYLSKNMQSPDDFLQVSKDYGENKVDANGVPINEENYPFGYPTFPVLEKMRNIYPWMDQIILRLTNDYLMNTEYNTSLRYPPTGGALASQFYTNFRKAYIPYGKIQTGINPKTGEPYFGVTPLNYQMEDKVQLDKLEANYNNRMVFTDRSIYNADGTINRENAKWLHLKAESLIADMQSIAYEDVILHSGDNTVSTEAKEEYNRFIDETRHLFNSFGINATTDGVVAYLLMEENGDALIKMLGDLSQISDIISKVADEKVEKFNYMLDTVNSQGVKLWSHFFDGRGLITDASYMQSYYDSASHKTKYSYSADNYIMKSFRGMAMGSLKERRKYIDEHYGKYEWFKNQKTGEWKNKWIEFWYNYVGNTNEIPYRNIDNITDRSGETTVIRPYNKWNEDDIWLVQDRNYYPANTKDSTAFYLAPIFSDSPMSMTVKGPKMDMDHLLYGYKNADETYSQGAFIALIDQEMDRIKYVQRRAKLIAEGKVKPIANFDSGRGLQFTFIPELNTYKFEDGKGFLEKLNELSSASDILEAKIKAVSDIVNKKMAEYVTENKKHYSKESITPEQYYNMVYANAAIIQATTVDLAFYKHYDEFQKRFKETYAGGIQINTNSRYGQKTENVLLVADDIITSPSYDKIVNIIEGSNNLTRQQKDDIEAIFTNINVADAQAIRSMHSFRAIFDMMGKWDDRCEEALEHFQEGTWNQEDFDIIYQTIKPFVYAVIEKSDGEGGNILVPQQHKNSEICALMMYNIITNDLNNSPVYKAFSRFMEENVSADGKHLIDMIQYESACKVGNQGVINVSFSPNKIVDLLENGITVGDKDYTFFNALNKKGGFIPNSVENAIDNYYGKEGIKYQLDTMLRNKDISQEDYNKIVEYLRPTEDEIISMLEQAAFVTNPDGTKGINPEIVHTMPMDCYYQQQPTPEHHIDAEAVYGSQERNITVADLPDNFTLVVEGRSGKNKKFKKEFKGRDAIIDFYYELHNENLIEDFFGKDGKGGLKGIFESKESLRDAVEEIVRGNPKYGKDFVEALQVDEATGKFRLSLNSPTIFPLMQEIVTSFFKNRITKQKINGAALIQAAGIGLDNDLRIVFDKNGKLEGAECYMPLTSKRFFEPLLEEKEVNGEIVKYLDPEKLKEAGLDKAIGYRIPTENKSSMMPLIIKGFTPLQNGSSIILPAEITAIAGSDFDVDKMFLMLSSFVIDDFDYNKAWDTFKKERIATKDDYEKARADAFFTAMEKARHNGITEVFEDDYNTWYKEAFNKWFEEHKEEYQFDKPRIRKIEYDFSKTPKENGRRARNNMLLQLTYNILISKEGSESFFNPQGFPDVERAAKIKQIIVDQNLSDKWFKNTVNASLLATPVNQMREIVLKWVEENRPDEYDAFKYAFNKVPDAEVQRFYIDQVTAGNKTEGIIKLLDADTDDLAEFIAKNKAPESPIYPQTFAHNHAKNMAGANQLGIYAIQGSMAAKYQRATVRMKPEHVLTLNGNTLDNVYVSEGGKRMKNESQMVGASADNGKKPNLTAMGSTSKTAPIIGYMLNAGISHLDAALIIGQPCMQQSYFDSNNVKVWGWNMERKPAGNVTTDMLIRGLISDCELTREEHDAIKAMCWRILKQSEAMEYLTSVSRADSPNGAMQNSYAKARIQQYKVDLLQRKMLKDKHFPFMYIREALSNTAVDTSADENTVREQLKKQRMGLLHGMYALGINSFSTLTAPYFFGARKDFDETIVKPILYNLNVDLPDSTKEEVVDNIYRSFVTYMLSDSPLFGDEEDVSMKDKRRYYLETFPTDYLKVISENEEIRDLLSPILQVARFGDRYKIIFKDAGSIEKGQKQDIQLRLESLLYVDSKKYPELANTASKLALDLFIYSYYENGLQFTHDSFSHLFTTLFLSHFPMYNETLDKLDTEPIENDRYNFVSQFVLTYPSVAFVADGILSDSDIINDGISISSSSKMSHMTNPLTGLLYQYVSYNGNVYINIPNTAMYSKITPYATFAKLPLFSRNKTVVQLADEFPIDSSTPPPASDSNTPPSVSPVESGTSNENPDVDNTPSGSFMDDFSGASLKGAPDIPARSNPTDNTNDYSDGTAELREPFC